MSWTHELQQAFAALRTGRRARVDFASRNDSVGQLGQGFNQLAEMLEAQTPGGLTRQQVHAVRNRLAGVLAALHMLRAAAGLTAEEQQTLGQVLLEAKELDSQLRARTTGT